MSRAFVPPSAAVPFAALRGWLGVALLTVAPLGAGLDGAGAQIIRPGQARTPHLTWAGAGVGIVQMAGIADYKTSTTWDFGTMLAWRASLDRVIGGAGAVGLSGSLARPSLTYSGGACNSCDARANLFQILGTFRTLGPSRGFAQVIELAAGVTGFSNFRADESDARLEPTETVLDPTIGIGYGFAYAFGGGTQLTLVQDYGLMLHRRDNAPGGAQSSRQFYVTRLGVRVGLGR